MVKVNKEIVCEQLSHICLVRIDFKNKLKYLILADKQYDRYIMHSFLKRDETKK